MIEKVGTKAEKGTGEKMTKKKKEKTLSASNKERGNK